MRTIISVTTLIIFLLSCVVSYAGTYQNVSGQKQTFIDTCYKDATYEPYACQKAVQPGQEVETYLLLDTIYGSDIWLKVSDEPYAPLSVYDQDIDIPAGGTVSVIVDPETLSIKFYNLGTVDIMVQLNSSVSPYPAVLKASNSENDADELKIINDKRVSVVYFTNLNDTTAGSVKMRVIP